MAVSPPAVDAPYAHTNMSWVLPLLGLGVELFNHYGPLRPYIKIAQGLASAAILACQHAPPTCSKKLKGLATRLEEIRRQVVTAEKANDTYALERLRIQQDVYTDFLLDALREA